MKRIISTCCVIMLFVGIVMLLIILNNGCYTDLDKYTSANINAYVPDRKSDKYYDSGGVLDGYLIWGFKLNADENEMALRSVSEYQEWTAMTENDYENINGFYPLDFNEQIVDKINIYDSYYIIYYFGSPEMFITSDQMTTYYSNILILIYDSYNQYFFAIRGWY